jgi:hypothetical protein
VRKENCRLLLELVAVRHMAIPTDTPYSCVQCRLQLHTQTQLHTITLTPSTQNSASSQSQAQQHPQTSLCTTQFTLPRSTGGVSGESVQLDVLLHRDYSPDVLAGRAKVALREMITASGAHRGPIVRQVCVWRMLLFENCQFFGSDQQFISICRCHSPIRNCRPAPYNRHLSS